MAFVKANFRTKATDIQLGVLGKNLQNWIGGSGINNPFGFQGGGFAFGSYATSVSGGIALLSAVDALTNAYGVTYVSNVLGGGAGFKYIPIAFQDFSGDGVSSPVQYHLSATQAMAGDDSIAVVAVFKVGAGFSGAPVLAATASVHFVHYGFIVSVPDAFR